MTLSIEELKPGVAFDDCIFLKKGAETKTGRSGRYLQITFSDSTGQKTMKKWQATEAEISIAMTSRFLIVSGAVERDGQFKGDARIEVMDSVDEPAELDAFLTPYPMHHAAHLKRFSELLKSIREPNLNRLLRVIFNPAESTWKLFKSASAAQNRHHAYRGGLIEHSAEVAELCDKACLVLPHLRRDFLVACALLHDIGKLEEMEHGLGMGEFTENGTLVGHTVSGAVLLRDAAATIENFPKNLLSGLMHMILSHHGNPDWGAARTPACAEAFVLHECDNMSAKAHEWCKVASQSAPGQFSVRMPSGEYYYVGDLGLQMPPDEPAKSQPIKVFTTRPEREAMQIFKTTCLSIKGMVAAGSPDQSGEEEGEIREVTMSKNGADYLLRVTGDSMVDAGIFPDDLLLVKSQKTAEHNDIVIANLASHGDVVKRLRRDQQGNVGLGQDWLDSENRSQNYQPIQADEHTRYSGIVVGLLKDE